MTNEPDQLASDWIAFARYDADKAPDQVFADGWALYDLVEDDPQTAWEVIKLVVRRYPEEDYYSHEKTEAQKVVGNLAAGPLEDLLSAQGPLIIEAVETEAQADRRMAWTLGGVWQHLMTDDIWARVQAVADDSFWSRPI